MKLLALSLVTLSLIGLGWVLIGMLGAGPQSAIHINKDALEQDRIEWVEQAKEDIKDESILNMMEYLDEIEKGNEQKKG